MKDEHIKYSFDVVRFVAITREQTIAEFLGAKLFGITVISIGTHTQNVKKRRRVVGKARKLLSIDNRHSPGAWEDRPQKVNSMHQIHAPEAPRVGNAHLVAMVHDNGAPHDANAQLIAWAPDLFELAVMVQRAGGFMPHFDIRQKVKEIFGEENGG